MKKTITLRASYSGLDDKLLPYTLNGWRVISKTRGSAWARIFNTYNWTVVLEKETRGKPSVTSPTDELIKAKELLDSGAITEEEYQKLKDKILNK